MKLNRKVVDISWETMNNCSQKFQSCRLHDFPCRSISTFINKSAPVSHISKPLPHPTLVWFKYHPLKRGPSWGSDLRGATPRIDWIERRKKTPRSNRNYWPLLQLKAKSALRSVCSMKVKPVLASSAVCTASLPAVARTTTTSFQGHLGQLLQA